MNSNKEFIRASHSARKYECVVSTTKSFDSSVNLSTTKTKSQALNEVQAKETFMKLTCTITANTKKATIIVNDDNTKTYTTSCVKQSSGRWAINLEKIEDAPQKWILVPGKPGNLEDMTFSRDFDKVKEHDNKVAKATPTKVQPTLAQWLESVVAQVAAHPDLTDDEVISITGAIKPVLDKIKVADEKKKLEQQIAETKSQLEVLIAKYEELSK